MIAAMEPYSRHPFLRALMIFGFVFFVGSLAFIAVESFGFDDFLFQREAPAVSGTPSDEHPTLFSNLAYIDKANQRVWFFQKLDTVSGTAQGLELFFRDAQGHDLKKYFAKTAKWEGGCWRLTDVRELIYGRDYTFKDYKTLDLPDVTTPPSTFAAPQP